MQRPKTLQLLDAERGSAYNGGMDIADFERPDGLPVTCTDGDLLEAVRLWLSGGDKIEIAALLKTKPATVNYWINSKGWQVVARMIAPEMQALVSGSLTRLKRQSLEQLADRIENGDYRMDNSGEIVGRVPMKGRDLVEVFAKVSDAQVQLEKMIGSIKDDDDSDKISLDKLALGLKRYAEARDITGEATAERADTVQ